MMVPGQQQEMGIGSNIKAYGISYRENKKDIPLWYLGVTAALYSILISEYSINSSFPFYLSLWEVS